MSNKPKEDQEENWGEAFGKVCKSAREGIEESGEKFQRGMGKHGDNED